MDVMGPVRVLRFTERQGGRGTTNRRHTQCISRLTHYFSYATETSFQRSLPTCTDLHETVTVLPGTRLFRLSLPVPKALSWVKEEKREIFTKEDGCKITKRN